jgi:hypothetical protein
MLTVVSERIHNDSVTIYATIDEGTPSKIILDRILWHVDPLLGNNSERSHYTKLLLSNGFANKVVSTATIVQQ